VDDCSQVVAYSARFRNVKPKDDRKLRSMAGSWTTCMIFDSECTRNCLSTGSARTQYGTSQRYPDIPPGLGEGIPETGNKYKVNGGKGEWEGKGRGNGKGREGKETRCHTGTSFFQLQALLKSNINWVWKQMYKCTKQNNFSKLQADTEQDVM